MPDDVDLDRVTELCEREHEGGVLAELAGPKELRLSPQLDVIATGAHAAGSVFSFEGERLHAGLGVG